MIVIDDFINGFSFVFANQNGLQPWEITNNLPTILLHHLSKVDDNYIVTDGIVIHRTAVVEKGAILKAPVIINENCFIGANAYLRGGVYLGSTCTIGPSCEIKSSIIFNNTSIAHFNFIGDSIIGHNVNFEAGSLTANHYNERIDKKISVLCTSKTIDTGVEKFGALVGDNSKVGANAVLSPGTILKTNTVVKRLELIDQLNKIQ
ncbi:LpxA family transferase [Legionella sp. MW5194]|uniref:DapH/DapD/GlmU-related protein n=1 Tax=Legionella sp. MW5194 TaxID=2662448 RepID=UPI00193E7636|nr:DapH/DapD/GlmU-related protein [Legionella sp. MW5194]QRN03847.1 LpxA family transferase [Legionella sp. MW5194]